MSLEFSCPNCRISLQVSQRQLGRQVRCPVCGLISVFGTQSPTDEWQPVDAEAEEEAASPESNWHDQAPGKSNWSPIEPAASQYGRVPNQAETRARAEAYVATYASSSFDQAPDRAWWIGLVCGLISLLGGNLVCFCCLVGPFGSTFFAIAGLVATAFSRRGPKAVNITIGVLGLLISLIMLVLMAISKMN